MPSSRTVSERAGLLLVLAVVAGLLVAGLALPFVGGVGLLAKKQDDALSKLPSFLSTPPLAQHSVLLAADGSTIATLVGPEDRVVVTNSQIPAVMQYAIVAIEDNRFFEHNGVDLRGVLRAASADTTAGDYAQGASTITEQYVKLVEVEAAGNKEAQAAATEKSLNRKLTDARLAIALEKRLSKEQILTDYLNIAYFGEGTYGVGTAAEHYFGIPVQRLSLAQAALLAGLVNNPTAFDPVTNPRDSLARRNAVLAAVAKYHLQPAAAIHKALATRVVVHPAARTSDSCDSSTAPLFCSYVRQQLLADPKLGASPAARANAVYEGGLKIYTTYDPTTQAAVNAGIAAHLPDTIRQVSSAVVLQPGTGAILAIGQNRAWGVKAGQSKAIYADQEKYDVGSTFKLMTLTAAIAQGIPLTTRIPSPNCYHVPGAANPTGTRCHDAFSNAGDGEACNCDLYTGTWQSVNTFYVQLEQRVGGPEALAAMAKQLGIIGQGPPSAKYTFQHGDYGYSLTLGSGDGFSVLDMATAYATIAAHGLACTTSAVRRITTLTGSPVGFTGSVCHQAVSADVADTVTSILQGVLNKPGATGRGLGIGRPAAGKTGTLDDGKGGWFVGYTPQLATAVGIFDPKLPSKSAAPITDLATGRTFSPNNFFGASIAGPIWRTTMEKAMTGQPVEDFTVPEANDPGAVAPTPTATPTPTGPPTVGPTLPAGVPTITVTPIISLPPPPKHHKK